MLLQEEEYERKCQVCNHSKARRTPHFLTLPRVLIVQLQRFRYDPLTQSLSKVDEKVHTIPRLDLSKTTFSGVITEN